MTVFNSSSYESAIVFSQEEFAKLCSLVIELHDAEKKDERALIDHEFLDKMYEALEGEGVTPSL